MFGRIVKARRLSTRPFEVKVTGTSMKPVLHEGDIIRIKPMSVYEQGDIIVFQYKNEGLLSHRILEIENGRYFCKGDNSFRMEDINEEQIIGKVILLKVRKCNQSDIKIHICKLLMSDFQHFLTLRSIFR